MSVIVKYKMFDTENLSFTMICMVFITTGISLTVILIKCAKKSKSKSYYSDEEIQSRMDELRGTWFWQNRCKNVSIFIISRTEIWLHRFWRRILETKCVGDKFEMLVTDSGCWWAILYIDKNTNITTKVANIMILPPTFEISHHHKVTNITMSPT